MKPHWSRLAAGLWGGETGEEGGGSLDWARLGEAALDRDALGPVDLKLIRALAERAGRPRDGGLLAVLGCLCATVRSGGLRIPAEAAPLAERLEAFLRGLHVLPAALAPEALAKGFAAAAEADPGERARALAAGFLAARAEGAYAAILGTGPDEFKPLIGSGRSLYFQKHRAAEASAGARLAALLAAPDRPADPAILGNILETVLHRFPLRLGRGPEAPAMEFRDGQLKALELGLRKRLLVVSGGPGTGKTSIVANLLRALVRLPGDAARPLRIRLAAPTGRAAQRLSDSLRAGLSGIAYPADEPASAEESARDALLAGLSGETLHRLLRYQPVRGEYHHGRGRPVPADLVIVDEVSMVDIFALARLLEALEPEAALILLGDMDQLPSVEAGAVLADLVPGGAESDSPLRGHLALLDRSHRSEAAILEVTRRINAQEGEAALSAMSPPAAWEDAPPWPVGFVEEGRKVFSNEGGGGGGGCRLLLPPLPAPEDRGSPAPGRNQARGLDPWLESWVGFHFLGHAQDPARYPGRVLAAPRRASYAGAIATLPAFGPLPDPGAGPSPHAGLDEAFAYLDQARILTFTRKGWHGSESVNRRIRDRLAPDWDPSGPPPGAEGFHGAPILILENEYGLDLFNGEVGLVVRLRGRHHAFFRKDGGYRAYPVSLLPRHELAFASTVHKAQGSEYDQVLIILPEPGNRLLFKETLYTAITRARHFAGLYGSREVFLEAVARRVARESGLREYLAAALPA